MNNHLTQAGFSLLEVLIAVVILSIGLLGFAQAEVIALRHNQAAYLQSLAEIQNANLAESLRACGVSNDDCITQQISNSQAENAILLPAAHSSVNINGQDYFLFIQWQPLAISTTDPVPINSASTHLYL